MGVKQLTDAGIHVVVIAGNTAEGAPGPVDACTISPASELSAITVGATEEFSDAVTGFSNFGKCLDIFAPGTNILSAGIASNVATKRLDGTSQAAPHVAGTVALIIGEFGDSSPAKMAMTLNNFATKGVIPPSTLKGSPNVFLRVPFKNCTNNHHNNHHNNH
jgi:subtilisin family serine protease